MLRWLYLLMFCVASATAFADATTLKAITLPKATELKADTSVQVKDPAAEEQRLIKLRERIYATQSKLNSALSAARAHQTYRAYPFRHVCVASDDAEIDFVTGTVKACSGPTLCSVRSAYSTTRDSCQSGKFTDFCVRSDQCQAGTVCNTAKQRCCNPADSACVSS